MGHAKNAVVDSSVRVRCEKRTITTRHYGNYLRGISMVNIINVENEQSHSPGLRFKKYG